MAVKLRLRREGTKKRPHYRVVAADARSPRDGRFIEIIGEYHPMDQPSTIVIDAERALHWLRVGAQPTDQVKQLLRIQGIWQEFRPEDTPTRNRSARADAPRMNRKARARAEAAAAASPPPAGDAVADDADEEATE